LESVEAGGLFDSAILCIVQHKAGLDSVETKLNVAGTVMRSSWMSSVKLPQLLLLIDSCAGLLGGAFVSAFSAFLSQVYGWSLEWTRFVAGANLVYGCYSGLLFLILYRKNRLPDWPVIFLVLANSTWAGVCFSSAWSATGLGAAHLIFEGCFVLALAGLEARFILRAGAGTA
jgi:hypothetical protein